MTKITLADLTSIQNDPTAVDTINDNSAIIEAAFDNTLSRDGTSPNEMDANIDMNNNRILNLPRPLNPNEPARLRDIASGGSGVSLPVGGATDQALVKNSNTDYDAGWHNVVNSFEGRTGAVVSQSGDYTKAEVGLGNVDNTSDLNKPISTATQTALDGKQPLNATLTSLSGKSLTGTGNIVLATSPNITTPTGIVKSDVGLGNVDNTSDANKPISTATQTALNGKQPLDATLTGLSGKSTTGTGNIVLATSPSMSGYLTINQTDSNVGLQLSNSTAPTPNKYVRVFSDGDLEVVNSAGLSQILQLSDVGNLTVSGTVNGSSFNGGATLTGTPTAPTASAGTNTTQIATTAFVTGAVREKLTANRTYYVRTDGSDSNTGLVNNAGGAFLTIQKAWDVIISTLDLSGKTVTVQIGDGTYTSGLSITSGWVGAGTVIFQGNSGTPANVLISTTSSDAIRIDGAAYNGALSFKDFELRTTTSGHAIICIGKTVKISFSNLRLGACAEVHLRALASYISCAGNYSITGSATNHMQAVLGGVFELSGQTVTLTGTPGFSSSFAYTDTTGVVSAYLVTYSGSATGPRYIAGTNSVIQTYGGGANYFPGNSAGSTATGGQYA